MHWPDWSRACSPVWTACREGKGREEHGPVWNRGDEDARETARRLDFETALVGK